MDQFIPVISSQLNNRELAIIIWGVLFFGWALLNERVRGSLKALTRVLFNKTILLTLFAMAAYICLITYVLHLLGLWSISAHIKSTMVWGITVALSMVINVTKSMKDEFFFRKVVFSTISLTIVLEFFIDLYPFNFVTELVLVPCFVLIGASLAIVESDKNLASLRGCLNGVLALIGFVLIWQALRNVFSDLDAISVDLLVDLALPSVLTLMFLPFIYFLALALSYSTIFFRITFQNRGSSLLGYAKLKALRRFGVNLSKLNKWSKTNFNLKFNSKDEIIKLFG